MNWWIVADVLLYLGIIEIIYIYILMSGSIGNVRAFKDKKWDAITIVLIPFALSSVISLMRGANENGCSNPTGCFKPEFAFWNELFFVTLAVMITFLIIVFFVKYYFELNVALGKKINKKHIEKFEKEEAEFQRKREKEKIKNGTKD